MNDASDPAGFAADDADALLAPHADALFWPPAAIVAGAPGHAHAPFSHWLIAAARPARVTSLAADRSLVFVAFCEAAQRLALPATCVAWHDHAAADTLAEHLRALIARRYVGLARQQTGGEPPENIDLLHIDAQRLSPARWATLRGHLADDAMVVVDFAGATPERHAVWRDLSGAWPSLLFAEDGGLGVVCLGRVEPRLRALCDTASPAAARARLRFAVLGERWRMEAAGAAPIVATPAVAELRRASARAVTAELQARAQALEIDRLRNEAARLRAEWDQVTRTTTWRLAEMLRASTMLLRGRPPSAAPRIAAPLLAGRGGEPPPPTKRNGTVLFLSGEPGTPGSIYRCARMVDAAEAAGWQASWRPFDTVDAAEIVAADVMIFWRVPAGDHARNLMAIARAHGARVGLDLDDLMVRPELARVEFIDALRLIDYSEARVVAMFEGMAQLMHAVDFCTATTPELAADMRSAQRAAYVSPNGFDDETLRRSRLAARRRRLAAGDGLSRLGYATGSRTHQKDFVEVAAAIADVLRARPMSRLVLFKSADDRGVLVADEFPALAEFADRIEWRYMVPLADLPDELARFDVNLAPLEVGNPFVEAKSELKYFEAALAGVPTIASPTGPYARAIADGATGMLASGREAWRAAMLRLLDDPELRARMVRDALHDVLYRFGPPLRARRVGRILAQQRADRPDEAAAAFALDLALERQTTVPPVVADTETLFFRDAMASASVTILVASFNYADYIRHALDSARLQTITPLDLVIVDDCSSDPDTVAQILEWVDLHQARFNRLVVLRHRANVGLGGTRNAGFAAAETPYVLPLDADNRLRPDTAARLLAAISGTQAAFAYPVLQGFGAAETRWGGQMWEPRHLVGGNYIDAMALVAKWAWAAAGGYYVQRDAMGWEDYALWCRLAELGEHGIAVPDAVAEYRLHANSMVNTISETTTTKAALVELVERRHPWLRIVAREARRRT